MLIAETRFRYFLSSDLQIDLALLFREETHDRLRGRHLGIEVKMRVNVARCRYQQSAYVLILRFLSACSARFWVLFS